jgi:hypothetical protein
MHPVDAALQERGKKMVAQLMAYEAAHPRQGPDADGRPYDPVRDMIVAWLQVPEPGTRAEVDDVRSRTIKSRTWEGFAWANHRFVISDEQGNALIIGYNEDAQHWFVDTTTPVHLPPEWVAEFVSGLDPEGRITGLENPRELHAEILRAAGALSTTVPNMDEVAEYLAARRAQ